MLRPVVRARQRRNDEGFRFLRINLITCPGSSPNCWRIASKVVRSSQAIWMTRSVCASSSFILFHVSRFESLFSSSKSPRFRLRRHFSLQYLTSSQTLAHFFRQTIGFWQTQQVFLGKCSFFIGFSMRNPQQQSICWQHCPKFWSTDVTMAVSYTHLTLPTKA